VFLSFYQTDAAPVWVKVTVFEVSTGGISSGSGHFADRYVMYFVATLLKISYCLP
jgi:hypothetical protein